MCKRKHFDIFYDMLNLMCGCKNYLRHVKLKQFSCSSLAFLIQQAVMVVQQVIRSMGPLSCFKKGSNFDFLIDMYLLGNVLDGWMTRFYVLFNSISVLSRQWTDDNERPCSMEPRLRLRTFRLERNSNPRPLENVIENRHVYMRILLLIAYDK